MKVFKGITATICTILSGVTMNSLWITHSDDWKYTIPIILTIISMRFMFDDKD